MNAPPKHSEGRNDRLGEVLAEWLEAAENGQVPDEQEYLRRYPEFAAELQAHFADWKRFPRHAAPLGARRPTDATETPVAADVSAGRNLGDYKLRREIGRGGMGVVYEAEQISLGRRVALKVLPFAATMDPRQLQRFQNEARAAAALEHPHIVPVYGVGTERGIYYYAMRLIDGQTLANLIAQHRPAPPATNLQAPTTAHVPAPDGPAEPTAPVAAASTERAPRDAAFFRRAAEWGIQVAEGLEYAHGVGIVHRDIKPANLMIDGGGKLWITDFGLARTAADSGLTMTGDVLGTLRYMSPEQALAKHGLVDHRTDIYALGATLYELLTGRPAVEGADRREILHKIAEEEPPAPRQWNHAIPIDLETIVLKALAKNPAERYATALELADDLRRFQEDQPIRARRPALTRRMGGWCRRHKPLVSGVVVLLLTVLLLGGIALWRQQVKEAATAQAVSEDLQEAERLQKQERWAEALQMLERATGRLADSGPEHLREQLERHRKQVALVAELEWARLLRSNTTGEGHFDFTESDRAYHAAFTKQGLDPEMLGPDELARRVRDSAIATQLVAALDDWAFVKDELRAGSGEAMRAMVRLADDDPWRQQLRDPKVRKDANALERLARGEEVLTQPTANLLQLGTALRTVNREAAVPFVRQAQQRHPADFWINFEMAVLLTAESATQAEAIGFYRAALAMRPHSAIVYDNLGFTLRAQKKPAEAEAAHRKAIETAPGYANAYNNLGLALRDQGKLAEAAAAYRKAIELGPEKAMAYSNLGNTLHDQKHLAEAEAAHRKAIEIAPGYAMAYNNLSTVLRDQGKPAEAVAASRKAIDLKSGYAYAYRNLGLALVDLGKPAEAEVAIRKAVEFRTDDVDAYRCLGVALRAQKKLAEAVAASRKAIELQPNDPIDYNNLGTALSDLGNPVEAMIAYRKAIELHPLYAEAHDNLGKTLREQKKLAEAATACRKAIEINPNCTNAHIHLGLCLKDQGKVAEAENAFRKAVDLQPNNVLALNNLGASLNVQKRPAEAVAVFRKVIELQPNYAGAYSNLGNALLDQKKPAEAEVAYRKAIEFQHDYAEAYVNLGNALRDQKKLAEAVAAYRKAIELQPNIAPAYRNLGSALRAQGKPAEAVEAYRKAIELQPDYVIAHQNLGLALLEQKKPAEAAAAFRRAIELKPDYAIAYYNLGVVSIRQGNLAEAAAACRKAIELKADYAAAHYSLGHALLKQGQFVEALPALKRGHELGSKQPNWPYPSAQGVRDAKRLVDLDGKLLQILKGDTQPIDAAERLELAKFCREQKRYYVAALRFYEVVLAAKPELADDLLTGHRYQAARSAVLAAAGQGRDPGKLTAEDKTKLRGQALTWLRADLQEWSKHLQTRDPKALPGLLTVLPAWQQEAAFAPLRDPTERTKLPADEQMAWARLWADLDQLAKQVAASVRTERFTGALTEQEKERTHEVKLQTSQIYLIDLESTQFDAYLRLHDAKGKLLAENDDVAPNNQNSRLIFTAPADGTYRLVATSFAQHGAGAYTLTVRSFAAPKK